MNQHLVDELYAARGAALDAARPEAVAKLHDLGKRTARERIAEMTDPGSFMEFGMLTVPADPRQSGPADGLVTGVATVDGAPVVITSYDYSVYGGSQSGINHGKLDRMIDLAYEHRWPFICFADGGGARAQQIGPGGSSARGQSTYHGTFDGMAALSGWVPTIAVVNGRSFAGNASIAGLSDFVVATRGSAIGMGGPPLVEAALGLKLTAEELAPTEMHERSGGIDLLVDDEPTAAAAARRYLTYFLGNQDSGQPSPTAETIRSIVPENRRRAYDMRRILGAIADADSVFELRPNWCTSTITALARMGGRAVGILANQPLSNIAGALDSDGSDKLARFIRLCDAFDLPLVALIDNPGFMLGPRAEQAGIARHHARPILAIHHRSVPIVVVQIRKAYGLGPQAMGLRMRPDLSLAWITAESGGMSLEGAASLVHRDQIRAAQNEKAAQAIRDDFATEARTRNSGLNLGRTFAFDDVIDPAETRDRIITYLGMTRRPPERQAKKHYVDTW